MRKYLAPLLFLLAFQAFAGVSNTVPPVDDTEKSQDINREFRRVSENVLPRTGGDDLFYRDVKNQRIGISITSPTCKMDVDGSLCSPTLVVTTATFNTITVSSAASMGGALNMNSNKIINLSNGSASSDGAAFGQIPVVATQAQQEAATATNVFVAPGVQQYHPGEAKAWVIFVGSGTVTVLASHNVSSVTDNGTGDYSVNFTTPFSSQYYSCSCTPAQQAGAGNRICSRNNSARSASAWRVHTFDTGGTTQDAEEVDVQCFGDQ